MILKTDYGIYDVQAKRARYYNNNLAIELYADWEPFARLTVNLVNDLDEDCAYVDTNNCPWAEHFIVTNNLGYPVGTARRSGYCVYPLYRFNLDKLEEM